MRQELSHLPEALKYLRHFARMPLEEAVERAAEPWCSEDLLTSWETGEQTPALEELAVILDVYGAGFVELQMLLELIGAMPPPPERKRLPKEEYLKLPEHDQLRLTFCTADPESILARLAFEGLKADILIGRISAEARGLFQAVIADKLLAQGDNACAG